MNGSTKGCRQSKPATFSENKQVAQTGGAIAGHTRKEIEEKTGKPVISPKNAAQLNRVVTEMIEGSAKIISDETRDEDKQES